MTDRERHPARGVALLVVAALLAVATAMQFHVGEASASNIVWLVTVVPAMAIAIIFTAAYGFFDLYGRAINERDEDEDAATHADARKDTP